MTVRAQSSPPRLRGQCPTAAAATDPAAAALRRMVEEVVQTTLEREFTRFLGAAPFERTAARTGVRNGTRPRALVTRVGRLTLRVPRDRASLFQPAAFARYQRHEQALLLTLAECYLQGVSTRKVRRVVEILCGETVSASLVSRATKRLDAALGEWRARPLGAQPIPYLVVDAHYEHIRRAGQVVSTAVLWVLGIRADGFREHLGCWLGAGESAASWGAVMRALSERGLRGVRYVVSDDHAGLAAAVQRYWPGAVHQRCQVHFQRNALRHLPQRRHWPDLLDALRDCWAAPTRAEAERRAAALVARVHPMRPELARWLEANVPDTFGYYSLPEPEARRRLRSTNILERAHEEVRRRTRVIRVFPSEASFLRLASALALDFNDGWAKRRYLIPDAVAKARPSLQPRYRKIA